MQWITDVLRLNTRILAAQAVADTQAISILESMEQGQDTVKAEKMYLAYRSELRRLWARRDTLLDDIKSDV
jgi:hypothetical protein